VLIRRARPLCGPPVLAGLFTFDLTCTQFAHAQQAGGAQMGIRLEQVAMTVRRTPKAQAAIQYLIWALEEIEKAGHQKAAHHARIALNELRRTLR
jgi:hypothetical protein